MNLGQSTDKQPSAKIDGTRFSSEIHPSKKEETEETRERGDT